MSEVANIAGPSSAVTFVVLSVPVASVWILLSAIWTPGALQAFASALYLSTRTFALVIGVANWLYNGVVWVFIALISLLSRCFQQRKARQRRDYCESAEPQKTVTMMVPAATDLAAAPEGETRFVLLRRGDVWDEALICDRWPHPVEPSGELLLALTTDTDGAEWMWVLVASTLGDLRYSRVAAGRGNRTIPFGLEGGADAVNWILPPSSQAQWKPTADDRKDLVRQASDLRRRIMASGVRGDVIFTVGGDRDELPTLCPFGAAPEAGPSLRTERRLEPPLRDEAVAPRLEARRYDAAMRGDLGALRAEGDAAAEGGTPRNGGLDLVFPTGAPLDVSSLQLQIATMRKELGKRKKKHNKPKKGRSRSSSRGRKKKKEKKKRSPSPPSSSGSSRSGSSKNSRSSRRRSSSKDTKKKKFLTWKPDSRNRGVSPGTERRLVQEQRRVAGVRGRIPRRIGCQFLEAERAQDTRSTGQRDQDASEGVNDSVVRQALQLEGCEGPEGSADDVFGDRSYQREPTRGGPRHPEPTGVGDSGGKIDGRILGESVEARVGERAWKLGRASNPRTLVAWRVAMHRAIRHEPPGLAPTVAQKMSQVHDAFIYSLGGLWATFFVRGCCRAFLHHQGYLWSTSFRFRWFFALTAATSTSDAATCLPTPRRSHSSPLTLTPFSSSG